MWMTSVVGSSAFHHSFLVSLRFLVLGSVLATAFTIPKKLDRPHFAMSMTTPTTMPSSKPMPKRSEPLPPMIVSTTPGTWAYDTMSRRVDGEIMQRTEEDNPEWESRPEFAASFQKFKELRAELQAAGSTKIRHLNKPLSSETEEEAAHRQLEWQQWYDILDPYVKKGDTWLSAPWLVTEFYAYRRLLEALGYWDAGNPATFHRDPFLPAKRAGLESSVASAEPCMERLEELAQGDVDVAAGIGVAAGGFALWGNKMDLSLWPANVDHATVDVFSKILASATENLLHDDTSQLANHCQTLKEKGGGHVDIIVDNAGFELITDLALADYLIQSGIAKCVTFQLKSHPTFVSDAMEKDLRMHVDHYAEVVDPVAFPHSSQAGKRWQEYLEDGRWKCHEDNFWVQPLPMWDMYDELRQDMAHRCDLAFVKGDANYRRLLGDIEWDLTNNTFQDVVGNYFPCAVCALRTLKAELGCGMDADQVERAKGLAPDDWMVTGRFGVVQFGTGTKTE
eukprot:CAMPEP_0198306982 /NCGR_PEP_ID=MMETSP1449-20131203/58688_1 /TAXON_ID=420275 /ORGANISM="Attheya septentrionalis, Strain CCMP2084" /LENGTH=507 /DNA_ID=CAMNT_0044009543 /DNA_START=22 /DNA_END=1545 /DNA_ORIENTATION=+